MLSRISIDIDDQNTPFIKIEYQPSPDVRDKMVGKFLESFGGEVTFAKFQYEQTWGDKYNSTAGIRAIPFHNLPEEVSVMQSWIDHIQGKAIIIHSGELNSLQPQTN